MKPFKSYAEQVSILISRGLGDESQRAEMERCLRCVGYYRLSAYHYPFRITESRDGVTVKIDRFKEGTTFRRVWDYYLFDRRLRLLVLDAVERVEVALRACIAYEWARMTGVSNPQGRPGSFATKYRKKSKEDRLSVFQGYYERSSEDFACHYKEELSIDRVEDLPVWVFIQFSTFGSLQKLYEKGLPLPLRRIVANQFGFQDVAFFTKVLALLLAARNACAHHGRLWNKKWKYDATDGRHPVSSRLEPICGNAREDAWAAVMEQFGRDKTAFLLTLLVFLLERTAPASHWRERVVSLLSENAPVHSIAKEMGFPSNWQSHPLWRI